MQIVYISNIKHMQFAYHKTLNSSNLRIQHREEPPDPWEKLRCISVRSARQVLYIAEIKGFWVLTSKQTKVFKHFVIVYKVQVNSHNPPRIVDFHLFQIHHNA